MRLKTAPKLLIIAAVVGGIGYGVNVYLERNPTEIVPKGTAPALTVDAIPLEVPSKPAAVTIPPIPASPAISAPQPAAPADRGLNKLLGQ